jgi:hypothetical protein
VRETAEAAPFSTVARDRHHAAHRPTISMCMNAQHAAASAPMMMPTPMPAVPVARRSGAIWGWRLANEIKAALTL